MTTGKLRLWALFVVSNLAGIAILAFAYTQGWIDQIIEGDDTPISKVIAAFLVAGLVLAYLHVRRLDQAFDVLNTRTRHRKYIDGLSLDDEDHKQALALRLDRHLDYISTLKNLCTTFGMLGTMVGIVVSLTGLREFNGEFSIENVKAIIPHVGPGLSLAFITSIVGLIAWAWLEVNFKFILKSETTRLWEQILSMPRRKATPTVRREDDPDATQEIDLSGTDDREAA